MKCYKCSRELPASGSVCPSCGQPAYTTGAGTGPSMGRRVDGALTSQPSAKDYIAKADLSSLPRRVDLREHCSAIEDQGQIGSCVACAVVGAMEYQMRKGGQAPLDLSRMFVYFNARRMRGTENADSGISVPEGLAAFLAFGAPPEAAWPYDATLLSKAPDQGVYQTASDHRPSEYARVQGQDNIRGALAQKFPVPALFQLPMRCFDDAGRTGVIPAPTQEEVNSARGITGHSMLVVGYDLDAGNYLIRNSWGADWGDHGYCRMSFETFEMGVHPASTWILGRLETATGMTVQRPALTSKPVEGGVRDMASKLREDIRGSVSKDLQDAFKDIKQRVNPPKRDA